MIQRDDDAILAQSAKTMSDISLFSWCIWRSCAPIYGAKLDIDYLLHCNHKHISDEVVKKYVTEKFG